MDAQQTLFDLMEAISEGDRDRVAELSQALSEWVANGGFLPEVQYSTSYGYLVNRP